MPLLMKVVSTLGVLTLLSFTTAFDAGAQWLLSKPCTNTSQCTSSEVCVAGWFNYQTCQRFPCNGNINCPVQRPLCVEGTCHSGCFTNANCGPNRFCKNKNRFTGLGTCVSPIGPG